MSDETIADAIERDAIAGVQKMTVDGMTSELAPLEKRIEAARYLAQQSASAQNHQGLRITRLIPGRP